MSKHLLSLLIGLTFISGCQSKPAPQPTVAPIPPQSFAQQWSAAVPTRGGAVTRMYLREPYLFAYTRDNRVIVLNRAAGTIEATHRPTEPNTRLFPPIVLQDQIIYPTHTTLEVFQRQGSERKSLDMDLSISTPAVEEKGQLFFGTDHAGGGRIVEADITRSFGYRGWQVMTLGGLSGAPALRSGVLYFGAEDGRVYAVTTDREQAWPLLERSSFDARGRVLADVVADDYAVYVAVESGQLFALDRTDGKMKWQYFAKRALRTAPVPSQQHVYQFEPNVGLVAIDKLQGEFTRRPKWVAKDALQVLSMDNEFVYVRLRNNAIAALEKATGTEKFRSQRTDFNTFTTNTLDSTIYAATKDGRVYAIAPVLKPGTMGELVLDLRELPKQAS